MWDAFCWTLVGLNGLIVLRWLVSHVEFQVREAPLAPVDPIEPAVSATRLSVIVAAHNEAAGIGCCLEKVLAQEGVDFEVVVANDRSTDDTGRIVRAMCERHANLRCLDITELPAGWSGKTHAMHKAAETVDGEYLVFTDSDVALHPRTLATIATIAKRGDYDFLSLWTRIIVVGFWERLLMPACAWVLAIFFSPSPPWTRKAMPAFANGQFLMMRRTAYERIGGHAAVADAIIEDVPMARMARAAGLKCYVGPGGDLIQTRMYENLRQILNGWPRIYIGALGSRALIVAGMVTLFLGCLLPFAVLAALAWWVWQGGPMGMLPWAWLSVAVLQLICMYVLLVRMFPMVYSGRALIWPFPLALLAAEVLMAKAFLLMCGVGTVPWGGVRYKVSGWRVVTARTGGQ